MMLFRTASATHVGTVRSVNQDAVYESNDLCAVADGMGGAAAGEVASTLALEVLREHFALRGLNSSSLESAVIAANAAVYEASLADVTLAGMGTTITAIAPVVTEEGDRAAVVNVGDSRCYLLSDGELIQLTFDHSVASDLVRHGALSPAEAAQHPQRHMLTRALGVAERVEVDLVEFPTVAGDRLLLCSDGLTNEVAHDDIAAILFDERDPLDAANALIDAAIASGGHDNISVVIVDILVGDVGPTERALSYYDTSPRQEVLLAPGDDFTGAVSVLGAAQVLEERDHDATAGHVEDDDEDLERHLHHEAAMAASTTYANPVESSIRRPRPLTLRTVIFFGLVAALLYGGHQFVQWFASTQYFVAVRGSSITIYQGQPGGTLWVEPVLLETTTTTTNMVLPSRLADLHHGVPQPSVQAAHRYITNLIDEQQAAANPGVDLTTTTSWNPAWTPPTTTTTTTNATTTTVVATTSTTLPPTTTPTTAPTTVPAG
jgi:protein phosphatase